MHFSWKFALASLAILSVLVGALAAPASDSALVLGGSINKCYNPTNCDLGDVCISGKCILGCNSDSDCIPAQSCKNGQCWIGSKSQCLRYHKPCKNDDECCSGKCQRRWLIFKKGCKHTPYPDRSRRPKEEEKKKEPPKEDEEEKGEPPKENGQDC